MNYLIVFLGAGVGGALRHGVNVAAARLVGVAFPFGTLAINVVGSLLMGLIIEYLSLKSQFGQHVRLFLTTGVIGGFTTFSAFSLEATLLWERGQLALAAAYVIVSVVLSITALVAGLYVVRAMP